MEGKGRDCERNIKRVRVRKSGCVESNEFCYVVKVNTTLSQSSLVQRVADYFFDSVESVLDLLDVTIAAWALAAFDFRQSCTT